MKCFNDAWIVGDTAFIDVSTPKFPRAVAFIDAADWDFVFDRRGRSRWHACEGNQGLVYVRRHLGRGPGARMLLHRFLLGVTDRRQVLVDHANRDGLDNRRSNLRLASKRQNNVNARGYGALGLKGVRAEGSSYRARITVHGTQYGLGTFPTASAAARAYDAAARDAFGEFACLNFPVEDVAA